MRFRRLRENLRCRLGLHRLVGYRDCGDGINVFRIPGRARPGPNDWRKCEWCGQRWVGAYDGIEPSWRKL